ncbi:hypothetical protein FMEXI_9173 [Fusarium mexicanum]|uniref:Uncharacterized protein n=1 Tax=Fusarium mexicanum TaxID=751941 RepID=A0A8H5IN32_9HYPO|nr:hypothetical protein FMEXI_9173 [Fusarium mexicanum]
MKLILISVPLYSLACTSFSIKEPLPRHLEEPIKMIEESLLKAHGIAVPEDGSTVFNYELRLSEMRDREHQFLLWQRRCIKKTEQEMRDCWLGSRKLMVLDLAFDLRDYWSDENIRRKINQQADLARESILREDEGVDDNDELPDVHRV